MHKNGFNINYSFIIRGGKIFQSWVWQDVAPRLFSVSTPDGVSITHKTTLFNIIIFHVSNGHRPLK